MPDPFYKCRKVPYWRREIWWSVPATTGLLWPADHLSHAPSSVAWPACLSGHTSIRCIPSLAWLLTGEIQRLPESPSVILEGTCEFQDVRGPPLLPCGEWDSALSQGVVPSPDCTSEHLALCMVCRPERHPAPETHGGAQASVVLKVSQAILCDVRYQNSSFPCGAGSREARILAR